MRRRLEKAPVCREIRRSKLLGWSVYTFIGDSHGSDDWITQVWFLTKKGAQEYAAGSSSR
jgi:hypothetical protein